MLQNAWLRTLQPFRIAPLRRLQLPLQPPILVPRRLLAAQAPLQSFQATKTAVQPTSSPPGKSKIKYGKGYYRPGMKETNVHDTDTVYALSSAPGRAGIAVIRISGPACLAIHNALCKDAPLKIPKGRYAATRTLYTPFGNPPWVLDSKAVVIYFEAPRTATGEPILELHTHGGNATVKAVLAAIQRCPASSPIRYAEPGEFTRRAFQNHKLDLGQVEALSDQLVAETEQQRRAAVRGSSKFLSKRYESWRSSLLHARGEIEALIDFSEDQHFDESPTELLKGITKKVETMLVSIRKYEEAGHIGELLKKGIRISLLGPPNVGKSSLLNQLVGREASIVSQEAGTTRDIVEVSLDIRGYLCAFADTAGLRTEGVSSFSLNLEPAPMKIGAVEQEGIRRARAKASESDIVIAMGSVELSPQGHWEIQYDNEAISLAAAAEKAMIVINKCDRIPRSELDALLDTFNSWVSPFINVEDTPIVTISCQDAQDSLIGDVDPGNIKHLTTSLVNTFQSMTDLPIREQDLLGVTERQRQLLATTREWLEGYLLETRVVSDNDNADIVIAAENLREAANCLARLTGRIDGLDVEEVLGVVFEKFCVGK